SMASVEVVYELRSKTDFILASPTETLASGMPYQLVIPHFFEGAAGLEKVAEKYLGYYGQQDGQYRSATISLIDTRELDKLAARSKAVLENASLSPDYNREEVQRLDFESPAATEGYDFLDFFQKNLAPGDLQPLADQLARTVLFKSHTPEFLGKPIETFSGLSCYIPHQDDDFINDYYKTLEWCRASGFNLLID
ncbi:MAG TPA: clostripain-related cysteine peptidase, partial [Anseongella sp.]|nr:clostripain-related cysteine peptidase [Anseongella sp.]